METEEERRARLENDAATKRLRLVMESGEDLPHSSGRPWKQRMKEVQKMEWIGFVFDWNLIWIEIGVLNFFKECALSPCNGNHFSSSYTIKREYIMSGGNLSGVYHFYTMAVTAATMV